MEDMGEKWIPAYNLHFFHFSQGRVRVSKSNLLPTDRYIGLIHTSVLHIGRYIHTWTFPTPE